ncbi:hypothetical protein A2397_00940 [Candidatus Amesbacteria bacterium RIFOXYB1_FULL_44_23]|uniref:Uncharacterized protein n=1 Tax=Candidatus Amesbacteria bacterium RIFOXYB1_FULL_44_23 TaxID=1797263 RepID=A0A1F4ZUU0_9BACT|nr:MAG: hypothetical protein A2397_00940 [Candidatus Amesbacteria bacterium RIFOXYB1_FULL_44_23]
MDNHPVPQNISSYEFRLVGDMTLKQFLQLAAGLVLAFVFVRLPILAIIKFPLAFLAAITGVLMAFVPINGRPFTAWLSAFIKAIYSPTEYTWRPQPVAPQAAATQTATPTPAPAPKPAPVPPPVAPLPPIVVPSPLVAPAVVKPPVITQTSTSVITSPPKPISPPPSIVPPTKTEAVPVAVQPPPPPTPTPAPTPPPISAQITPSTPAILNRENPTQAPAAAVTNQISPPTSPNILAGLITDPTGNPLPQTTVEIIDLKNGIPARALRTNRLGQFQIAIPLPSGKYNILVEKEGLRFDPVSIEVKGNIVPPVIIQGYTT